MTDRRKPFSSAVVIATMAVDVLGIWTAAIQVGAAGALPPAGANGIVARATTTPAQVAAPPHTDQLSPLASKRRKKPR